MDIAAKLLDVSKTKNEITQWLRQILFDTGATAVILNSLEPNLNFLLEILSFTTLPIQVLNKSNVNISMLDMTVEDNLYKRLLWALAQESSSSNKIAISSSSKQDLIFHNCPKENIYFPLGDLFDSEISLLKNEKNCFSETEWALKEEIKFNILSSNSPTKIPIWFSYNLNQKKLIGKLSQIYKFYNKNQVNKDYVYIRNEHY